MTPPGSTGARICLKFRKINFDRGSMASGTFRARQKTGFASGFSLIVALKSLMSGKTFISDKDAL